MDMLGLMKQAQALQARLKDAQAEVERIEIEGQAGGGLVRVTLTGKGTMRRLSIDPSLLVGNDVEILEDLIIAAYEDARKKVERATEERTTSVTQGLPLPPGMTLPF